MIFFLGRRGRGYDEQVQLYYTMEHCFPCSSLGRGEIDPACAICIQAMLGKASCDPMVVKDVKQVIENLMSQYPGGGGGCEPGVC